MSDALPASAADPPWTLDRVQAALLAGVATTCAVSIFAAQVLITLAVAVFLARLALGRASWPRTPLDAPILAFVVWTLLSAAFSPNPLQSHRSAKQLVLFVLLYVAVETMARAEDRERILDAALLGGVALGAGTVLQYYFLGFDTLNNRPRSFLGHYMTASGLSMGALVLGAARLAHRELPPARPSRLDLLAAGGTFATLAMLTALKAADLFAVEAERLVVAGLVAAAARLTVRRRDWPGEGTTTVLLALVLPLSAWALLLSQTRSAWLGALVGVSLVTILRAPKLLWLVAAAVAVLLILRPEFLTRRLTVTDASSRDRYYMWQAGIDMVREKPVFGQGPGMILDVYPDYRWPDAPNPRQPHLHDNALQVAAERGLPALALWLWWVSATLGDAWRERRAGGGAAATATLGFLAALMAAGLFEYNFGDSEILMLTLLLSALPYALRRERDLPEAAPDAAPEALVTGLA